MYQDPEERSKRRLITWGVLGVIVVILLIIGGVNLVSLHRTKTADQNKLLTSNQPTVVMFYSKTCPDCKKIRGVVKKAEFSQKFATFASSSHGLQHQNMFVEWQNKHDKQLFKQYKVNYVPTFMVFKNGQPQIFMINNRPYLNYSGTDPNAVRQIYTNLTVR